jgi:methylmalonyl-CoA mutase
MITARDPWVNMLRATLACFAAGVGGANSVTVLPFDAGLGLPDPFSRRIARNTQSLLISESHVARVVDPAGGSWYVEQLTDALSRRAWEVFTGLERAGGLATVLHDGSLAGTLAATWSKRAQRLATRREPILGVSEFPNIAEKLPRRAPDTRPAGRGVLPRVRRAAAYEALRDRADAHTGQTGQRPAVFLATLGSVAAASGRSGFAANLFQAGGLATPTGGGDAAELAEAFRAAGTPLACLCGTDQAYAEQAEAAVHTLREAGASTILLAGKPGTAAGDNSTIDGYVYAGCDAIEVLTGTLDNLGVQA